MWAPLWRDQLEQHLAIIKKFADCSFRAPKTYFYRLERSIIHDGSYFFYGWKNLILITELNAFADALNQMEGVEAFSEASKGAQNAGNIRWRQVGIGFLMTHL